MVNKYYNQKKKSRCERLAAKLCANTGVFFLHCAGSRLIKTKANFEKRAEIPATTSGHHKQHALIECSRNFKKT